MTLCKTAQAAIKADVQLAKAIRTWDAAKTHGNAQKVLDALHNPTNVSATYAETALWVQRLKDSVPE